MKSQSQQHKKNRFPQPPRHDFARGIHFAFFSFDGAAAGKPRGVRQSVAFLYFYPANPRRPRHRGICRRRVRHGKRTAEHAPGKYFAARNSWGVCVWKTPRRGKCLKKMPAWPRRWICRAPQIWRGVMGQNRLPRSHPVEQRSHRQRVFGRRVMSARRSLR